jgi:hypothetical protein
MAAMASGDVLALVRQNIAQMSGSEGFDVVIVCCSSDLQAKYWQKRLEAGRGSVLPKTSIVLSVQEDWPGGAGNGTHINTTF